MLWPNLSTRTSPVNNELKQQGDGAGETSRTTNYELQGTGWATRAPVAQTLQTVRQTCSCTTATCPYQFARFPSCGIFTPTRTIPVNNELKQQGDGAGETSRTTNYELHGTGWATRAPVAQTLQSVRQTCPCIHRHVPVPVCTISILLNFHTNPYYPSEKLRVATTG